MDKQAVMEKQRVIAEIGQVLAQICDRADECTAPHSGHDDEAAALYDRIAPLREFPEKAIWRALSGVYLDGYTHGKDGVKWEVDAANKYIPAFKRLWEGQEKTRWKEGPLCLDCDKPKGGCPTCGGSKTQPCDIANCLPECTHRPPCSDCDGTGGTS